MSRIDLREIENHGEGTGILNYARHGRPMVAELHASRTLIDAYASYFAAYDSKTISVAHEVQLETAINDYNNLNPSTPQL